MERHNCKLSVNINKVATLRNARGGMIPDLVKFAIDCERFGAEGITVHPRPDERHIRYQDVYDLKKVIKTEYNIEGYPSESFLKLVEEIKPDQVTLVPDPPDVLTSNAGWDTIRNFQLLKDISFRLQSGGMRVSVFIDPDSTMIEKAADIGVDRIELYTEAYASSFENDPQKAVNSYTIAAKTALARGLGLNAGHDLNLKNLKYFNENVEGLLEVSIGHALISDALYYGIENTIQMYRRCLK